MNNNDSIIASNACAVSTALWAVKQFIDVNFKDDKCSSIENCIHKSPTNKCGCIKDCQYKNK